MLQETLENTERDKYKSHKGFKDILGEIDAEMKYINKHITRMKDAGAIKKSFISGNVSKKV